MMYESRICKRVQDGQCQREAGEETRNPARLLSHAISSHRQKFGVAQAPRVPMLGLATTSNANVPCPCMLHAAQKILAHASYAGSFASGPISWGSSAEEEKLSLEADTFSLRGPTTVRNWVSKRLMIRERTPSYAVKHLRYIFR